MISSKRHLLCESFTLSLQQTVTSLGSLELRLHDTQLLPSREDWLAILHLLLVTAILLTKFGRHLQLRQTC